MSESPVLSRRAWRARITLDALATLLFTALAVGLSVPQAASGQSTASVDPAWVLPGDDELPDGFAHQPQYDVMLEEESVARAYRFYTRGEPDIPFDDHASILLGVAIADTIEDAAGEFHDGIVSWTRMGYRLASIDVDLGDEAMAGWDGLASGDYPKRGALVLARFGAVIAAVQWIDDPDEVTIDAVVDVARVIEQRAYAAQTDPL